MLFVCNAQSALLSVSEQMVKIMEYEGRAMRSRNENTVETVKWRTGSTKDARDDEN